MKFWQQFRWGFRSPRMWPCVAVWVGT